MSNLERTPTLTRMEEPAPAAGEPVHELITAREVDLGEGTRVRPGRLRPRT